MGEALYDALLAEEPGAACRVYAPVGEHRDLLAYLVRRLLENGANSSFVHQLADPSVEPEELLASPLEEAHTGAHITCLTQRAPLSAAIASTRVEPVPEATQSDIDRAMARLAAGHTAWS